MALVCSNLLMPRRATLPIFFNNHESDVVRLRDSASKVFDRIQELLFQRVTSGWRLLPNDFEEPLLSEHFFPLALRVGKTVGINQQNVSLAEVKRVGPIRGLVEHSQHVVVGYEPFDFSRGGAIEPGWIVSG